MLTKQEILTIISLSLFTSIIIVTGQECGIQLLQNKITGGYVANIDEFPWAAIIRYRLPSGKEDWGCGGTYVSTKSIITAAHCTDADLGELLFVRLGEFDVDTVKDCIDEDHIDCADDPIDFTVKDIVVHPQRDRMSKKFDIAILILNEKPPTSDFIRPICLPFDEKFKIISKSSHLFVTGWGWITGLYRTPSSKKLYVKLNYIDSETCFNELRVSGATLIDNDTQICASGKEKGQNPCRGDSGGPLMLNNRETWILIGVVSFGTSICALEGVKSPPTVFVKVTSVLPWIDEHIV